MNFYLLEGDINGYTIRSNVAVGMPALALQLDYPLLKVVADAKRNFVYGIVSPESRYDENQTGYGIVFINTASQKVEKRILETVRFNDIDINPQGDRLYLSERNRKIYVIDLNTQELIETISLENFIRKLEVGINDRLYFHVELAANNNYEFRIVDLVTKKELPFKFSGTAGGSFDSGDIDLDQSNNTIYFSGPARIKTTFDIFSDAIGTSCCSNPQNVIFRNGKVFVQEKLFNQDLVLLGSFSGQYGEEYIFDCNANATLAVGWYSIFNVADRSVRKPLPLKYSFDQAVFLDDSRLLFVQISHSVSQVYRSDLYIYQFRY